MIILKGPDIIHMICTVGIDIHSDICSDMAASINWGGPLTRSCVAPLQGFWGRLVSELLLIRATQLQDHDIIPTLGHTWNPMAILN